jgi:HlyD family secretion protein
MKTNIDQKSTIEEILEIGRPGSDIKRLKKWLFAALALIVIGAMAIFFATRSTSTVTQYRTEEARRGNLTVIVTATGTLQPTNKVEVGSELSGTIKTVEVDYNSKVKIGQVLARLDTTKLEAQLTQSRAALESAKAKTLQAEATVTETRAKLSQYQKVRELSNGRVPSQSEMDAAQASFERAKADLANSLAAVSQAQASVKANETDLSKSVIKSPINGIVLTRAIEPGQTVAATMTTPVLFTLAEDLTQMELHVNVDEADIGKVQEGQKATFTVAAYPNRTFDALIIQTRFGSSTTSGVVTYETVLKVNNRDLALRPGMTATADMTVQKIENAVLIPSAALRFAPPVKEEKKSSGGLVEAILPRPPRSDAKQPDQTTDNKKEQRVWALKDKQPTPVSVKVGSTNGGLTEVTAGDIQPGMAVIVDITARTK